MSRIYLSLLPILPCGNWNLIASLKIDSLNTLWAASLCQLKTKNTWCPYCAGKARLTIEHMHELAHSRGGKCLSDNYVNSKTKLIWQCALGHIWKAIPLSIKNHGTWCNECNGNNIYTIKDMQQLARKKGGECLSTEYKGNKSKLIWKCKCGYIWETAPSCIISGRWCHRCGGSLRLTIQDMHMLAESNGGRLLSDKYINARKKLLWECQIGHQFFAVPDKIKNLKRWCRECKNNN